MFPLQPDRIHAQQAVPLWEPRTPQIFSFLLDSVESFDVSCSKRRLGSTFPKETSSIQRRELHPLLQNDCRRQEEKVFGHACGSPLQVGGVGVRVHAFPQVVAEIHQHLAVTTQQHRQRRGEKQEITAVKSAQLILILSHISFRGRKRRCRVIQKF